MERARTDGRWLTYASLQKEVILIGLLSQEMRARLPPLYANETQGMTASVIVKYFTPDSNWTWYATEFDGEDIFFGLVVGHVIELGYFSLSELESIRGPLGLLVEQDKNFEHISLQQLWDHYQKKGWAI